MRFGVVGTHGDLAEHLALAEAAEAAGWDGFFTWDGVSVGPAPTWDPFTLLAAVAARTRRIRLGVLVVALPRRLPWDLARQVLTLDHLSGGRLVLPVGVGVTDDRAVGGVSGRGATPHGLRDRADLLDETLAVLDAAASGEPFSHHGAHHRIEDMVIAPPTVQRPRVPVWPVTVWPSERSMARAARWDGATLQLRGTPRELTAQEVAAVADDLCRRRGSLEGFDLVLQAEFADRPDAAEQAAALGAAGATWMIDGRWEGEESTFARQLALIEQGPPRL